MKVGGWLKGIWITFLFTCVVGEWILLDGQLSPLCSSIKFVTLCYDANCTPVPVTDKGVFSTVINSSNIVLQATGCGLVYRKTWNRSFSFDSENIVTRDIVVSAIQQVEAAQPETFSWSSPILWLVLVGILFLLFVPTLAQILDDDLYEELMGEKKPFSQSENKTLPTLGYRYITQRTSP